MNEKSLETFRENFNCLRRRVYEHYLCKLELETLQQRIDAEFVRLANAVDKGKGSPKSYSLLKVDFSPITNGWIHVSCKDGFGVRLYLSDKKEFRDWVELPGEEKNTIARTFTRNKKG